MDSADRGRLARESPRLVADLVHVEQAIRHLSIESLEELSDWTANLSIDAWRERRHRQGASTDWPDHPRRK